MTKSIVLMKQKFREFFIPTVLAAMANQLGTVLDSIVVAALLGTDAMVSVGLCMPYVQAAGAVVVLVAMGSSGMIAVAAGGGRREEADGIFSMVLALEKGPLSMLANLFGKEKEEGGVAKANTSGIQSFSYRYHNSFRAGSYAYEAECEEEAVTLGYKAADYSEFGKMTCQPEQKLLTELDALCREFSVAKWNGFNKSDPNALDGDGFSLDIKYKDGGKISAHGSNAYPKGYGDFRKKLNALMKPYVDAMLAEEIRKSREKGVSGELRGYSVNFLQRGESGRDKYKFFILDSGSREDNVDIEIESVSGDIFPAGKYRYYGHLDDAALRFGEFQAILDKYNIVNWNYYDRVAEDYNNSEWFQVTFYFSSGDSIQAMGTEHPEQYDAFRKEWLELVLAMEPDLKALSH